MTFDEFLDAELRQFEVVDGRAGPGHASAL